MIEVNKEERETDRVCQIKNLYSEQRMTLSEIMDNSEKGV